MRSFFFVMSFLMMVQSVNAGLTRPYKTIVISCSNSLGDNIVMTWKVPKSSFVETVVLNGQDQSLGVHRFIESDQHIYEKPDVFLIKFDPESEGVKFNVPMIVYGEKDIGRCTKSVSSVQFTE